MIRISMLLVLSAVIAWGINETPENYKTDLMREILLERSMETSLNARGVSGFLLTSRCESIFEKGMILGINGLAGTISQPGDDIREFGASVSWAAGLTHDLFGPFSNLEVSANLPLYIQNDGEEVITGLGDAYVSAKMTLLEEDPMRPSVPAIAFIASAILPLGRDEFALVGDYGFEGGMIFGKTVENVYDMADFQFYIEVLGAMIDTDDATDFQVKGNVGIGFTPVKMPDYFFTIEYGTVTKNADALGNRDMFAFAAQYNRETFNFSIGVLVTDYEIDMVLDRRMYIMYNKKY